MTNFDLLVAPAAGPAGPQGAADRRSARPAADQAEEARLLALFVAGRGATGELAQDISTERRAELQRTVRAAEEARRLILEAHQGLVAKVAYRYRHSGVPMADLMQEGNLGLLAALDRFDPEAGSRFASFAWYWIRQTILAGIPRHRRGFSLSPGVAREVYRMRKVRAQLESEIGREATAGEMAEAAKVSPQRVMQLEALTEPHHALTETVSATLIDVTGDGDPSRITGQRMAVEAVRELVERLPVREQYVIRCRYGMGPGGQRLSDIAEVLGVTASRACQIEREALQRLRRLASAHDEFGLAA